MGAASTPRPGRTLARSRAQLVAIGVVTVTAAVCLPTASQAAWYYPGTLTAPGVRAAFPTVASNGRGVVVVAWYRVVRGGVRIEARTSDDGGRRWGARQDLGPGLIALDGNRPALVRAAVGSDGLAAITWQQRAGSSQRVVAATAGRGARFGRARVLSAPGAFYPDVAVDGSGRAVVVWVTAAQVQRAVIRPHGAVGRRRTVATGAGVDLPTVAADARGDLVFAWVEHTTTIPPRTPILVARESARGTVTGPQQLAPDGADLPQAVIAPGGRATVAWESGPGVATPVVLASSAPWGRRFGARQRLSRAGPLSILGGGGAGSRGLGVDGSGRVSAIWAEVPADGGPGVSRIRVATSTPNGRFQPTRTLQTVRGQSSDERPAIGVASGGAVLATWTVLNGTEPGFVWGTATRSARGRFARPTRLSRPLGDGSAIAATSHTGGAVAVWTESMSAGPVRASLWVP